MPRSERALPVHEPTYVRNSIFGPVLDELTSRDDNSFAPPVHFRYNAGMRRFRRSVAIIAVGGLPLFAAGKERHLDQVRTLLVSKAARCTACHTDAAGEKLNAYGDALHKMAQAAPLAERIARLDSEYEPEPEVADEPDLSDVDGDGVDNWIEILAETNPAEADSKPDSMMTERIEKLVDCTLCHKAVNLPGGGLKGNPHNEFGSLLARTVPRVRGRRPPRGENALREAAERVSIIARIAEIKTKRPRRSRATYWEKMRLLHAPADANDKPSAEAIKAFKKLAARQRRKATRDPNLGLDTDAHKLDGFLEPAKTLP